MSPNATLYYGFHLGCPDDGGWEVAEADEYGDLEGAGLPWLEMPSDEDEDEDGVSADQMRIAIFLGMGVEAADVPTRKLDEALAERCGVQVVEHGSLVSGIMHYGIALAGTIYYADDYTPKAIAPGTHSASHKPLLDALKALGLTPKQANPSWILAPGEG